MAGLSLTGVLSGYGSDNSSKNNGMTSEMRRSDIERRINADERKLRQLDSRESAEKTKLSLEISKYKNKLEKIEQENEPSEMSEAEKKRRFDSFECETCKNRRYKDESDDAGVSFQTATHVDPSAAYSAVRSHENEHVARNRTKAEQNGQKIVYQTVTIHKGICPECGRTYTAGGVTRTVTKADNSAKYTVGDIDLEKRSPGKIVNVVA